MPTFTSTAEMESYIKSKLQVALGNVRERVYEVIDEFLKQYYGDYMPKYYQRTRTFLHSLVKSDVESTGNGYKIYVYFDVGLMNHATHALGWTEAEILDANLHGVHGGAGKKPTAPWDDSLKKFDASLLEELKRMLIAAGLPVK